MVAASRAAPEMPLVAVVAGAAVAPAGETTTVIAAVARVSKASLSLRTIPTALAWLGSVHGHRTRSLGVEHFGQTGTIADLYRHFGIDAHGIAEAVQAIAPGKPIRHLMAI